MLKLVAVSGDHQVATSAGPLPAPIVVRLTDANNLPYPGAQIVAAASAGGSVTPAAATTDVQGQATFTWTPGPAASNLLQLAVGGAPAVSLTLSAGSAVPVVTAVVNAASSVSGVAAGAFETIYGVNLAGGQTAGSAGAVERFGAAAAALRERYPDQLLRPTERDAGKRHPDRGDPVRREGHGHRERRARPARHLLRRSAARRDWGERPHHPGPRRRLHRDLLYRPGPHPDRGQLPGNGPHPHRLHWRYAGRSRSTAACRPALWDSTR